MAEVNMRALGSRDRAVPLSNSIRKIAAGIGSVFMVLALAACAQTGLNIERDTSARATLDFNTGQLITPMTAYLPLDNTAERATVDHARRIYLSACMSESGYSFTAIEPSDRILDDRRFGIWLESKAAEYGWADMPDTISDTINSESAAGGPSWDAALDSCYTQFHNDPTATAFQFSESDQGGRASELVTQAYDAAARDPEWNEARKPWEQCLRDAGLTPAAGEEMWMSEESKHLLETEGAGPSQESIRLASIEARCNMQTNLTQRLGDLVASYEQPLIDAHEAELQPIKERKDAVLAAARDYIAAHG